jgi:hypothetical protein
MATDFASLTIEVITDTGGSEEKLAAVGAGGSVVNHNHIEIHTPDITGVKQSRAQVVDRISSMLAASIKNRRG